MTRCGNLPFDNGEIPSEALRSIGEGSHRLDPAAAVDYRAMKEAAAREGVKIRVSDSYRSYAGQVACSAAKGNLCATPGTSKHGCGLAIDVSGDKAREWVQVNGQRFGWVWPSWARRPEDGGSKYEPWHFEHGGDGTAEGSGVAEDLSKWEPSNPLVPDELETFGHFLGILTEPETWVRIAWTVGGGIVVLVGVYLIAREMGLPSAGNLAKLIPAGKAVEAAKAVAT